MYVYLLNICLQMHVQGIWFCNEDKHFCVTNFVDNIRCNTSDNFFLTYIKLFFQHNEAMQS